MKIENLKEHPPGSPYVSLTYRPDPRALAVSPGKAPPQVPHLGGNASGLAAETGVGILKNTIAPIG